jgi:hypothetical protein
MYGLLSIIPLVAFPSLLFWIFLHLNSFFFFFPLALGFELRHSDLLDRSSYQLLLLLEPLHQPLPTPLFFFVMGFFKLRSPEPFAQGWQANGSRSS